MTPAWILHPEAQALLAAIAQDRPEPNWHRERGMFPRSYPRYANQNVGALRVLHDRLCEEAVAAGADRETFADLYRNEPDDVVFEMLREGLVEVEHISATRVAA